MKKLFTKAAVDRAALAQEQRQERRSRTRSSEPPRPAGAPTRSCRAPSSLDRSPGEHRERPGPRPRGRRPCVLEVDAARGEAVDRRHETGDRRQQRLERRVRSRELGPVVVGVVQGRRHVGAQRVDHDPEHVVRQVRRPRPQGPPDRPRARAAPPVAEGSETVRRTSSIGWAPHAERSTSTSCQRCALVRRHVGLGNRVRRARGVDDGDLEVRGRSRGRGEGRGRAQPGPRGQRHAKGQRRRRRSEDRLALVVAALVHVPHPRLGDPGAAVSAW